MSGEAFSHRAPVFVREIFRVVADVCFTYDDDIQNGVACPQHFSKSVKVVKMDL